MTALQATLGLFALAFITACTSTHRRKEQRPDPSHRELVLLPGDIAGFSVRYAR